jgi:hypothetical protein
MLSSTCNLFVGIKSYFVKTSIKNRHFLMVLSFLIAIFLTPRTKEGLKLNEMGNESIPKYDPIKQTKT